MRLPRLVALLTSATLAGASIASMCIAVPARAQDSPQGSAPALDAGGATTGPETASAPEGAAASPAASPAVSAEAAPARVAVVLVGDPNEEARACAARVERAVGSSFALPSDAALRGSLLGNTTEDVIAPVVRDRRALGGTEMEDLPLLGALGDRADVTLLLVVRRRAGARELIVYDVRHRAYFEGALPLDASDLDDARITRFVRARARAAAGELDAPAAAEGQSGQLSAEQRAEQQVVAAVRDGATAEERQPEWIEVNWPYLLAGALLAGAAAFVIVYTVDDQPVTPTLRFRPGGTP